jgi:hypothetical protein
VLLLLSDRRTIGELQLYRRVDGKRVPAGEPIKGYFATPEGETVVSEETFYLAQAMIAQRWCGASVGRRDKVPNLLVGIARCQCAERIEYRPEFNPYAGRIARTCVAPQCARAIVRKTIANIHSAHH